MARTSFVVRYDFRAPGATPDQRRELFRRAVEQAAYAERHGIQALMLSEHHASPDGYLPSPIPVAAAFAAVTSTIPISVAALLVNLYDPVRLAEEIAVLRDQRGLGLARAMLVDAFGLAREHGAVRCYLSTDSRTGALGLYEKVGMVVSSTWVNRGLHL